MKKNCIFGNEEILLILLYSISQVLKVPILFTQTVIRLSSTGLAKKFVWVALLHNKISWNWGGGTIICWAKCYYYRQPLRQLSTIPAFWSLCNYLTLSVGVGWTYWLPPNKQNPVDLIEMSLDTELKTSILDALSEGIQQPCCEAAVWEAHMAEN